MKKLMVKYDIHNKALISRGINTKNIESIIFNHKLKVHNGNKMPGFFEGLKLLDKLKGKDFAKIFIIPYIVKSTLSFLLSTSSMQIRKKACNIGVMNATTELTNDTK